MSSLAPAELIKYDWRISLFLQRYIAREEFDLIDGKKIKFIPDPAVELAVASKNTKLMRSVSLLGVNNREYRFSDLQKTRDFGGEGDMRGISVEEEQVLTLNTTIRRVLGGDPMMIRLGNQTSRIKMFIRNPNRYQKADILGLGDRVDQMDQPIFFISYKVGGTAARHWQQFGGLSKKHEPTQHQHPEIQSFADAVSKKVGIKGIQSGQFFRRTIKDPKVRMRALYGSDFGHTRESMYLRGEMVPDFSPNNVHALYAGHLELVKPIGSYNEWELRGAKYLNGEEIVGDLEPVLSARRGERNDFGILNCRMGVFPRDHKQGAQDI